MAFHLSAPPMKQKLLRSPPAPRLLLSRMERISWISEVSIPMAWPLSIILKRKKLLYSPPAPRLPLSRTERKSRIQSTVKDHHRLSKSNSQQRRRPKSERFKRKNPRSGKGLFDRLQFRR